MRRSLIYLVILVSAISVASVVSRDPDLTGVARVIAVMAGVMGAFIGAVVGTALGMMLRPRVEAFKTMVKVRFLVLRLKLDKWRKARRWKHGYKHN